MYKKITEQELLDGYVALSKGLMIISDIDGHRIYWYYRRNDVPDAQPMTMDRDMADIITLEAERTGEIALDDACTDHPAVIEIRGAYTSITGDTINTA